MMRGWYWTADYSSRLVVHIGTPSCWKLCILNEVHFAELDNQVQPYLFGSLLKNTVQYVKESLGESGLFSVLPSLMVLNGSLELPLRTNTACRLPTYHDGWRDCYSAFRGSARLPSCCLLRWPLFSGRLEESPLSDWNKWDILKLRH